MCKSSLASILTRILSDSAILCRSQMCLTPQTRSGHGSRKTDRDRNSRDRTGEVEEGDIEAGADAEEAGEAKGMEGEDEDEGEEADVVGEGGEWLSG